jgi:hypothetical protein
MTNESIGLNDETPDLSLFKRCLESIQQFNDISGFLNKEPDPHLESDMLISEHKEYLKAIGEDDMIEIRDGLADQMVVLYGTMLKHKMDFQDDDLVNNMDDHYRVALTNTIVRSPKIPDLSKYVYLPLVKDELTFLGLESKQLAIEQTLYTMFHLLLSEILYQYGDSLKFFFEDLWKVCESNMSKFCVTEEEAERSIQAIGDGAYHVYNEQHKVYVVKYASGKTAKSVNFKTPELEELDMQIITGYKKR